MPADKVAFIPREYNRLMMEENDIIGFWPRMYEKFVKKPREFAAGWGCELDARGKKKGKKLKD